MTMAVVEWKRTLSLCHSESPFPASMILRHMPAQGCGEAVGNLCRPSCPLQRISH